jgi:hypothetical protein
MVGRVWGKNMLALGEKSGEIGEGPKKIVGEGLGWSFAYRRGENSKNCDWVAKLKREGSGVIEAEDP